MKTIFVFGSNLSGIHGAGAAKYAHDKYGAQLGIGEGRTGDSYAIPTKSEGIKYTLPLEEINDYVNLFIHYARICPELTFKVTRIGCGLAGLKDSDIAPMFQNAPSNCQFDHAWAPYLKGKQYWGTF